MEDHSPELSEKAAILWNNLGAYKQSIADYPAARAAYERALQIDEAVFGPKHPNVARDVNNLGNLLYDLGDLAGARAAYEHALRIDETIFGPEHPDVARDMNNLGNSLYKLGDLAGARAAYDRALRIWEAAYGPEHPQVATVVNNLGGVLSAWGDLAGARAAYERALRILEAAYGPEHPQVATAVNNLGGVLSALGDLAGARAAYERALRIDETIFGPEHPQVAAAMDNLGRIKQEEKYREMAELVVQRGEPTVVGSMSAVKGVVFDQGGQQVTMQINVAGNVFGIQGDGAVITSAATDLSKLRDCLQRLDAVEIETLCLFHFPIVYDKFGRGMRRDEMINLLLDHVRRNSEEATRLMSLLQRGL